MSVPSERAGTLTRAALGLLLLGAGGGLFTRIAAAPPTEVVLSCYATSLNGRTASQRRNAMLSARALNGTLIGPHAVFSFNRTVRTWSADAGYVKAPVSFDGEMVRAYGGGVCQTSTTLYNAALLAGLPILERHPHVFVAHYAPPGRDAAVAQERVDLRFRNPYGWPLRLEARARQDLLEVRIIGRKPHEQRVAVTTRILAASAPMRLTRVARGASGRVFVRNPGSPGVRVVAYRVFSEPGRQARRERLSDDTYQQMNRVVQVSEAP